MPNLLPGGSVNPNPDLWLNRAELTMTKKYFLLFSLMGADPTLDNAA